MSELVERVGDLDLASASFTDLIADGLSFTIDGVSLVDKRNLLGVPHIITAITWQRIKPEVIAAAKKRNDDPPRGFVSIEATIASGELLDRAVKRGHCPNVSDVAGLLVDPNERVVYNDGSTGIRRQCAKLLHTAGMIRVATEITTDRGFDVPWTAWEWHGDQLVEHGSDDDGEAIYVPKHTRDRNGKQLTIFVPRGLAVSAYDNDYGEAETFYLR